MGVIAVRIGPRGESLHLGQSQQGQHTRRSTGHRAAAGAAAPGAANPADLNPFVGAVADLIRESRANQMPAERFTGRLDAIAGQYLTPQVGSADQSRALHLAVRVANLEDQLMQRLQTGPSSGGTDQQAQSTYGLVFNWAAGYAAANGVALSPAEAARGALLDGRA